MTSLGPPPLQRRLRGNISYPGGPVHPFYELVLGPVPDGYRWEVESIFVDSQARVGDQKLVKIGYPGYEDEVDASDAQTWSADYANPKPLAAGSQIVVDIVPGGAPLSTATLLATVTVIVNEIWDQKRIGY